MMKTTKTALKSMKKADVEALVIDLEARLEAALAQVAELGPKTAALEQEIERLKAVPPEIAAQHQKKNGSEPKVKDAFGRGSRNRTVQQTAAKYDLTAFRVESNHWNIVAKDAEHPVGVLTYSTSKELFTVERNGVKYTGNVGEVLDRLSLDVLGALPLTPNTPAPAAPAGETTPVSEKKPVEWTMGLPDVPAPEPVKESLDEQLAREETEEIAELGDTGHQTRSDEDDEDESEESEEYHYGDEDCICEADERGEIHHPDPACPLHGDNA